MINLTKITDERLEALFKYADHLAAANNTAASMNPPAPASSLIADPLEALLLIAELRQFRQMEQAHIRN